MTNNNIKQKNYSVAIGIIIIIAMTIPYLAIAELSEDSGDANKLLKFVKDSNQVWTDGKLKIHSEFDLKRINSLEKYVDESKVASFFVKIIPIKSILILEESLVSGQLESLGRMISKLSGTEFGNTVKYVNMWEGNAFSSINGEKRLIRVFDNPLLNTNINDGQLKSPIKKAVRLVEGLDGVDPKIDYGLKHIKARHIGPDATASSRFPLSYTEDEVIDLISEGLKYGQKRISTNPENLVIEYTPKSWKFPLRIVVEEKTGNLVTAFPTKNMR